MTTYLIRQDSDYLFTVSKWECGKTPTQIYRVETKESGKFKCNCPSGAYRGYCKHMDMVRSWIKQGMPQVEICAP